MDLEERIPGRAIGAPVPSFFVSFAIAAVVAAFFGLPATGAAAA